MCAEKTISREHQYTASINARNAEVNAYWTRYNIQMVLNWGLLAAAVSAKPDSVIGCHIFEASIIGIILSLIWLSMAILSKRLILRWDKYIRQYEESYSEELQFALFKKIDDEDRSKCFLCRHWFNLNIVAWVVPCIVALLWLFILFNSDKYAQLVRTYL